MCVYVSLPRFGACVVQKETPVTKRNERWLLRIWKTGCWVDCVRLSTWGHLAVGIMDTFVPNRSFLLNFWRSEKCSFFLTVEQRRRWNPPSHSTSNHSNIKNHLKNPKLLSVCFKLFGFFHHLFPPLQCIADKTLTKTITNNQTLYFFQNQINTTYFQFFRRF